LTLHVEAHSSMIPDKSSLKNNRLNNGIYEKQKRNNQ